MVPLSARDFLTERTMAFAAQVTKVVDIASTTETATIRKLTGRELRDCMELMKTDTFEGAVFAIKHGLTAWSRETPIDDDALDRLDDEELTQLSQAVMVLTKPVWFQSVEEDKDEQKKD